MEVLHLLALFLVSSTLGDSEACSDAHSKCIEEGLHMDDDIIDMSLIQVSLIREGTKEVTEAKGRSADTAKIRSSDRNILEEEDEEDPVDPAQIDAEIADLEAHLAALRAKKAKASAEKSSGKVAKGGDVEKTSEEEIFTGMETKFGSLWGSLSATSDPDIESNGTSLLQSSGPFSGQGPTDQYGVPLSWIRREDGYYENLEGKVMGEVALLRCGQACIDWCTKKGYMLEEVRSQNVPAEVKSAMTDALKIRFCKISWAWTKWAAEGAEGIRWDNSTEGFAALGETKSIFDKMYFIQNIKCSWCCGARGTGKPCRQCETMKIRTLDMVLKQYMTSAFGGSPFAGLSASATDSPWLVRFQTSTVYRNWQCKCQYNSAECNGGQINPMRQADQQNWAGPEDDWLQADWSQAKAPMFVEWRVQGRYHLVAISSQ